MKSRTRCHPGPHFERGRETPLAFKPKNEGEAFLLFKARALALYSALAKRRNDYPALRTEVADLYRPGDFERPGGGR